MTLPPTPIKGLTATSVMLAAMLIAFAMLAMRIAAVDSPIMASDEYAYFATAKYSEEADRIYQLDPAMQPIENKVYPALYDLWSGVSERHAALVGRLFNAFMYVLGALVLFNIFCRVFNRRSALISALLYLALPLSFYSITLLPEVEFQLSVYLVSLVVVAAGPKPSYRSLALAAGLSALSYFIKPHAAALIAACGAFYFAAGALDRRSSTWTRLQRGLTRGGFYLGLSALLILVVTKLYPGSASTGDGVVSTFYLSFIDKIFDADFMRSNLMGFLDYVGGHLWVFLVLFAPGLAAIAQASVGLIRGGDDAEAPNVESAASRNAYFALYVFMLLVAFVLMVGLFTVSAASTSAFEKYRLHGRYLAPLLPFLLAYSVWASGRLQSSVVAVVALTALVSFVFVGRGVYKIYPWDYPEIFGFFAPSLPYWSFEGSLAWPVWLILGSGVSCWLLQFRKTAAQWPYVAFALTWALAAHAQMWSWLDFHTESSHQTIEAATAIDAFLGDAPAGSGMIASRDRYGQTSFLLMGLDPLQHVRAFAVGQNVKAADIPAGVSWVVAPQEMDVDIPGMSELTFGNQRLFLLDGKYQWPVVDDVKPEWDGTPVVIDTGTTGGEAFRLRGFNAPEEWGSWSKQEHAYVELPVRIGGKIVVSFSAWQLDQNPNFMLTVRLGDAVEEVRLSNQGKSYVVELNPRFADDRLVFESEVVRTSGEARALGVALSGVHVAPAPTSPHGDIHD